MIFKLTDVLHFSEFEHRIESLIIAIVGSKDILVRHVASLEKNLENCILFCSKRSEANILALATLKRCMIVVGSEHVIPENDGNLWIQVTNPRLAFALILGQSKPSVGQIHSTAIIHRDAVIADGVAVGENSVIGSSIIGRNTSIAANVYIGDNVNVGENVIIKSGAVIGNNGFGFEADSNGVYHEFPHFGGVIIEDNVQIGSNTCIDRGALGNTVIRKGTKVDNLVHIAHNCDVGENVMIIAQAELSGSVKVGDRSWIAPGALVLNGITVGRNSMIGIGAICTRNLPDNHRLIPAFSVEKSPK